MNYNKNNNKVSRQSKKISILNLIFLCIQIFFNNKKIYYKIRLNKNNQKIFLNNNLVVVLLINNQNQVMLLNKNNNMDK